MPPAADSERDERRRAHVLARSAAGAIAFDAGDLEEAHAAWAEAVRTLTAADDDLAPAIYENLGLAAMNLARYAPAIRAFYRALDGDPTSRRQSAIYLPICLARAGHPLDARAATEVFEAAFGPHPAAWLRDALGLSEPPP